MHACMHTQIHVHIKHTPTHICEQVYSYTYPYTYMFINLNIFIFIESCNECLYQPALSLSPAPHYQWQNGRCCSGQEWQSCLSTRTLPQPSPWIAYRFLLPSKPSAFQHLSPQYVYIYIYMSVCVCFLCAYTCTFIDIHVCVVSLFIMQNIYCHSVN